MKTLVALMMAVMFVAPIGLFAEGTINLTQPHTELIIGIASMVIAVVVVVKYKLWEAILDALTWW